MKFFPSKSAKKNFSRVYLQNVNPCYTNLKFCFTLDGVVWIPFFNQGVPKIFPSKSAGIFSIKVRLKNKNQSLIDPDQVFNHDPDRDENFFIKVCQKKKDQCTIAKQ
jgi:hypothetical protein